MMSNKYKNKKAYRIIDGDTVVFDSKKEALRFDELYSLTRAKSISKLTIQPSFDLIPTQKHNGVTYRGVKYIADFKYVKNNITYVEDVKSDATRKLPAYRIKVKLLIQLYGKEITFIET